MNTAGKWLSRAGSLLILLGFFLPSMAVSCSTLSVRQSFSLANIAGQGGESALYLVLICALGALALASIPAKSKSAATLFIVGQLASMGVGILTITFSILSIYQQFRQATDLSGLLGLGNVDLSVLFEFSLEPGFFVLLVGFLLILAGSLMQFRELSRLRAGTATVADRLEPVPVQQPPALPPGTAALEVIGGSLPRTTLSVADNTLIGRSQECQVQIREASISRQHARLRFAQGAWFIQDQNSASGTLVNDRRVQAVRLNNGDRITIGSTTFIFRV